MYPEKGCTYRAATNYNDKAQWDDGSCNFGTLDQLGETVTKQAEQLSRLEKRIQELEKDKRQLTQQEAMLKEENEEVKQTNNMLHQRLDECKEGRLKAENEKQRYKILLLNSGNFKNGTEGSDHSKTTSPDNASFQISTQRVTFNKRQYVVKLPVAHVTVELIRHHEDANTGYAVGTRVKSVEQTATSGIDFSPIDTFLVWEPGESRKTITLCVKSPAVPKRPLEFKLTLSPYTAPGDPINVELSLNSTTSVSIEAGDGQDRLRTERGNVARQQRVWWAYWSKRIKNGYTP
eukprot:gb/GECG01014810.1/.p1 GENE.gb/GECG01014810.1/~~gb/GECG01014810.1/.p1  ORF type:complete len:291 (+),score=34.34 gb/GECG01014810.1/:1-873(+)